MNRRKELKEIYKNTKSDMGIIIIKSNINNNKCYIEASKDLKSTMNRARFQLNFGSHPNKELQEQWKEQDESNFTIEILEKLKYDENEQIDDYQEELNIMKMIWEEKLTEEGKEFYIK